MASHSIPYAAGCSLALTAFLCACGGGGGDDAAPDVLQTVNVSAAWQSFLSLQANYQTRGKTPASTGGIAYTLTADFTRGAMATFAPTGTVAATEREALTVDTGDGNPVTVVRTLYAANGSLIGFANDDGSCARATQASPLPASSPVGSAGILATTDDFSDCTTALPPTTSSHTTYSYSVENDADLTLFCVDEVQTIDGQFSYRQDICIEAAADGTLGTKARVTEYLTPTVFSQSRNY